MSRLFDDETIERIRQERAAGKTAMQLANKYCCHYRTVENYCRSKISQGARKRFRDGIMSEFMRVI